MHSYAAITGSFWTLEDTLLGFMFNKLIWCGQQGRNRGFDYQSCPKWSTCLNHPVYSLWKQASQNHVFSTYLYLFLSMFGSVELDNLNPRMVTHVHIKVTYNLEGPFLESCTQGSIRGLIEILKKTRFPLDLHRQ
ncbi:ADP-ribosyl cyclase/cyclic ADP-ribose hydrolase [Labeo rohita]|uniref:ADP-ribosyl cyclase/cyclic ADP-ribose hydrolase n=1 Tax=Labeo rohita TaxID=84645 RepID=A0ABQ8L929_LABRO|nr:ADP-ribosyl cyclase/cyclic ADP-ribose hydrolase [Labeo rohita]